MKTASRKVATTSNRSIADSSSKNADWMAHDPSHYTATTIAENCPVEIPAQTCSNVVRSSTMTLTGDRLTLGYIMLQL